MRSFQHFVRGTLVLWGFGRVRVSAGLLRSSLLTEIGVGGAVGDDAGLAAEVCAFLAADDPGVAAGRFLFFSPSFLLSFYGILATYVAIMIQSL